VDRLFLLDPFDPQVGLPLVEPIKRIVIGTEEVRHPALPSNGAVEHHLQAAVVKNQRVGDTTPFVFRYLGADGTPNVGRFPKNPSNFVPQVLRDPALGGPVADDFPFGRELAPINGKPPHYVLDNLIAAADWLTRALLTPRAPLPPHKRLARRLALCFGRVETADGPAF
jgi:hypothetical protein